jgi:UDP-N-acetylmuramoylalanine--D-glutamate ligase
VDYKRISFLGFGKSTISALDYLVNSKCEIKDLRVSENKDETCFDKELVSKFKSSGVKFEWTCQSLDFLKESDFISVSPGIPPDSKIYQDLKSAGFNLGTDLDLWTEFLSEKKYNYVFVTGTNGKTTTSSLLAHLLGTTAIGNIGVPVFDFEKIKHKEKSPYVVELSSFQGFHSKLDSKTAKLGIYLNFSDDHLDWHSSLKEYREAKEKLFISMFKKNKKSLAIFNYDDDVLKAFAENLSQEFKLDQNQVLSFSTAEQGQAAFLAGSFLYLCKVFPIELIKTDKLQVVGKHNYENVLAASLAAFRLGIEIDEIRSKLIEFKPVEHRLEFITEIKGKKFYNDSKATNPNAAIKALNSFEKTISIVGGKEKNLDLEEFLDVLIRKSALIIVLGELKERISKGLEKRGFTNFQLVKTLGAAIEVALNSDFELPVLLSPASSSFDMFKNYEDRGNIFRKIVLDHAKNSG